VPNLRTPSDRTPVETWFVRRGLPHFIEPYRAGPAIWSRAVPVLVVTYLLGGLNGLDLHRWSAARNLAAAALVVAILLVTWMLTNLLRHRPALARPRELGPPELVAFVVGPSIPAAIFGQWGDALQSAVEGAAVLATVYVVTSYGMVPLLRWAAAQTFQRLGSVGRMLTRALPLLLLFTVFLFINAEVWQVAGTLHGPAYPLTLLLFFLMGSLFVLSRVPRLISGLADFGTWSEVRLLLEDSPAHGIELPAIGDPPESLSLRERVDLYLLTTFNQAVQITLVAFSMFGFFVLLGFLAIPLETQLAWTGVDAPDALNVRATVRAGGRELVLTEPLLRVAGFLGAFVGMYFTVVLTTDATYRDEFSEDTAPSTRQLLAVRVAYRWARDLDRPAVAP